MISFLNEHGLLNIGDILLLIGFCIAFSIFVFRTAFYLYFKLFGVSSSAQITSYEKVSVLKDRDTYGAYDDTYQYIYEYHDRNGEKYKGIIKKLFLSEMYEIGEEIQIRYLKHRPKVSRFYSRLDWLIFEFMSLLISVILFIMLLL